MPSALDACVAVDALRPRSLSAPAFDGAVVLAGSMIIALSAQVAIPVGFSPVPITGQTFGVLLVAALLGARRGAAAVLAYLAEGAAGLPVFAGGAAGAAWLAGPTGGYLLGFVPAAIIVGGLAGRGWDRRPVLALTAMALGTVAIFACGLAWLGRFVEAELLLPVGLWPFLPGAVIKIALAAALLPAAWRVLGACLRRG